MQTRTDFVYELLIDRMVTGDLRPGDLVHRRALADELDVSISPVNEAILQLEIEGLLETVPRKGTRVRTATQRDVWGFMMTRIAIETQAARMICGPRLEPHADRLRGLAGRVDEAPDAGTGAALIRADVAFHRALVQIAECPSLQWHFDRLMRQSLILLPRHSLPPHTRGNHVRFVDALRADDPDAAEALMRAHIQSGKAAYALERGLFPDPPRPRFGQSPLRAQNRMGDSMERLLADPPGGAV